MNRCRGQLRLAPNGHVLGLDLNAALKLVELQKLNPDLTVELLEAAETGLIEAFHERSGQK